MEKDAKIYIAGHSGLIGSVICRKLREVGYGMVFTIQDFVNRGQYTVLNMELKSKINCELRKG